MNFNKITLVKQDGMWVGIHEGPQEKEVRDLFGTNAIPTAFNASEDPTFVINKIQKLNPDCVVLIVIKD